MFVAKTITNTVKKTFLTTTFDLNHCLRASRSYYGNLFEVPLAYSEVRRMSQYKPQYVPSAASKPQTNQVFDYFLVLDFEATCDRDVKPEPQEIIEFPVLKINSKSLVTESQFHQYVQPDVHKELTSFCTELTGIIQEQVDGQSNLQTTLQKFHEWMKCEGLLEPTVQSIFVTCGDWDLKTMLRQQCSYLNIQPEPYFNRWINIKKPFCDVTGTYPKGMMPMLQMLNLTHQGRQHSGIDDCTNIAKILKALAERGCLFKATGSWS